MSRVPATALRIIRPARTAASILTLFLVNFIVFSVLPSLAIIYSESLCSFYIYPNKRVAHVTSPFLQSKSRRLFSIEIPRNGGSDILV